MWLRFPEGAERISVELQHFEVEVKDSEGFGYFRVPDHFAPRILAIPGFIKAENLPEGAPEDLPKADPLRDNAIASLTATVEAQKIEIRSLSEDLSAAQAEIKALIHARNELERKLEASEAKVAELQEDESEAPSPPLTFAQPLKRR